MLIEVFKHNLKKYFYLLQEDRYENNTANTIFSVLNLKHPLVKPELIVINDELVGFKAIPKYAQSLDKFEIVCELESYRDDIGEEQVDSINLFCEIILDPSVNIDDIVKMAAIYGKTTEMEYVRRINSGEPDLCIVYSKLNTVFFDHESDDDFYYDSQYEALMMSSDFDVVLELHFKGFINFIRRLDRLVSVEKAPSKTFLS